MSGNSNGISCALLLGLMIRSVLISSHRIVTGHRFRRWSYFCFGGWSVFCIYQYHH